MLDVFGIVSEERHWNDRKCPEKSHENATVQYLKELPHDERLKRLKLPTLRFRRLRGDRIETYKILNKIYDERVTFTLFSLNSSNITRGHSLKLVKNRCRTETRKNFFTNRVVDVWNNLPNSVVTAKNVETFKRRLDKHWCHTTYDLWLRSQIIMWTLIPKVAKA
jgi:hypothetical protein